MKKIIGIITLLLIIYIVASYLMLDGKLFYNSTFNSSDYKDSINKDMFLNDLNKNYENEYITNFKMWTEDHYKTNHFGIFFYYKEKMSNMIKIRMEGKTIDNLCCDILINDKLSKRNVPFPYKSISIYSTDRIEFKVKKCKTDTYLFELKN